MPSEGSDLARAPSEAKPSEAKPSEAKPSETPTKPKDGASAPSSPSAPATPPKRERFRIHNSCSKPVKLKIDRVSDSDTETTLTNQTEKEERGTDGDEVRLLSDKNDVVHTIKIEPWMKLVDVTSSCTKLEGK